MKKVLVIGSNSFSGSDFIDYLLESGAYAVTGISRSKQKSEVFLPYMRHGTSRFRFFQLDINRDAQSIARLIENIKPHVIVNFAAQVEVAPSWDYPERYYETNAVAVVRLIHTLRSLAIPCRYVHISTPEVYGSCTDKVKEDARMNPSTPYAAAKASADLYLSAVFKQFGFPILTIRSTNVYGAYQPLFKLIPKCVVLLKKGKVLPLHGGGRAVKTYIHIRDATRGTAQVMEEGRPGEIYHFSTPDALVVRDVVKMLCTVLHMPFGKHTKDVAERPGQDKAYLVDSTKARREFGWKPRISFEDGIRGVVSWIEENWPVIKDLPVEYQYRP